MICLLCRLTYGMITHDALVLRYSELAYSRYRTSSISRYVSSSRSVKQETSNTIHLYCRLYSVDCSIDSTQSVASAFHIRGGYFGTCVSNN